MTLYLIHIAPPYKQARHYLGITKNLKRRLWHHRHGSGAKLLRAAIAAGCAIEVVRKWRDSEFTDEQRLKRHKNSPRLCPLCNLGWKRRGCKEKQ